ncbi:MAG: sulfotransferase [Pseudomonadota bacterium]
MAGEAEIRSYSLYSDLIASVGDQDLVEAAQLLLNGRLGLAEPRCRAVLQRDPENVNAICLLADIGLRVGALADAEKLLNRCLELQPDYHRARVLLASTFLKKQQFSSALQMLDEIDEQTAGQLDVGLLKANIYSQTGRHEAAIEIYRRLNAEKPGNPGISMSLAHALKTVGLQAEAIEAYRAALAAKPTLGDAYWSLANLKTYRFDDEMLSSMIAMVDDESTGREDFYHLCFAIGKCLEDRQEYDRAFWYYQRGNVVRRGFLKYDPDRNHNDVQAHKAVFTEDFVRSRLTPARSEREKAAPVPIFIVGLPRAGSTLVEQILASHSCVEGTQELPDVISIARRLSGKKSNEDISQYPHVLKEMSDGALAALGEEYLQRTGPHRNGAPYFIDKMPNNFMHIGLIKLMLPSAIIIDARRNPMDCCFSGYKQLFARGQNFTYSLTEIARYYRDYVDLMRHWDRVLSGGIIRVINEDLISDPETEIRRLLDRCGLDFEENCLSFYQTKRAVKTASSEQVRQPINNSGVNRWKFFEKKLDVLKSELGSIVDNYRT